jgi:hypothetical protein
MKSQLEKLKELSEATEHYPVVLPLIGAVLELGRQAPGSRTVPARQACDGKYHCLTKRSYPRQTTG